MSRLENAIYIAFGQNNRLLIASGLIFEPTQEALGRRNAFGCCKVMAQKPVNVDIFIDRIPNHERFVFLPFFQTGLQITDRNGRLIGGCSNPHHGHLIAT